MKTSHTPGQRQAIGIEEKGSPLNDNDPKTQTQQERPQSRAFKVYTCKSVVTPAKPRTRNGSMPKNTFQKRNNSRAMNVLLSLASSTTYNTILCIMLK